MIDEFVESIFGAMALAFLIGFILAKLNKRYRITKRPPYSWSCPRCPFAVSGNDHQLVLNIADHHETRCK